MTDRLVCLFVLYLSLLPQYPSTTPSIPSLRLIQTSPLTLLFLHSPSRTTMTLDPLWSAFLFLIFQHLHNLASMPCPTLLPTPSQSASCWLGQPRCYITLSPTSYVSLHQAPFPQKRSKQSHHLEVQCYCWDICKENNFPYLINILLHSFLLLYCGNKLRFSSILKPRLLNGIWLLKWHYISFVN